MQTKFLRWPLYWLPHQSESLPNDAPQALIIAQEMDSYPSLAILIQILATLPVTTATNERSFRALKYFKTYLRNTTKEVRLNGLALLYVRRDISLDFEQVIAEFSRKNQRLKFNSYFLKIFLETLLFLTVLAFHCCILCNIFVFNLTSKRKKKF